MNNFIIVDGFSTSLRWLNYSIPNDIRVITHPESNWENCAISAINENGCDYLMVINKMGLITFWTTEAKLKEFKTKLRHQKLKDLGI